MKNLTFTVNIKSWNKKREKNKIKLEFRNRKNNEKLNKRKSSIAIVARSKNVLMRNQRTEAIYGFANNKNSNLHSSIHLQPLLLCIPSCLKSKKVKQIDKDYSMARTTTTTASPTALYRSNNKRSSYCKSCITTEQR